jgi:hypothetical protein
MTMTTQPGHGRTAADRSRVSRVPASRRSRPGRGETNYGGYVDGANALDLGYAAPATYPDVDRDRGRGDDPYRDDPYRDDPYRRDSQDHDNRRAHRNHTDAQAGRTASSARQAADAMAVAPPAPVALPRASFLVLVLAVVVAGVVGVLVINTKINENAFRLDDLRAHQAALDLQEQQLAQKLAEQESPGNLAAAAQRLGLVPAGTPAFITLPDGRVVGVPQPATGGLTVTAQTADPGR